MKILMADLRHRLMLCRQDDVAATDTGFELRRTEIKSVLAHIEEKSASAFTKQGAVQTADYTQRTHIIHIRYRHSINLSQMAWLYEQRRKSSPRWFKILSIGETENCDTRYWKLNVRLVERSDEAAKPINPLVIGLPDGVKL